MTTQTKSTSYKKHIISFLLFLSLLISLFPAMPIYALGAPSEQIINFCSKNGTPADFTLETDGWQVDTTNTSAAIPGRTDNWVVYANSFMKAQMAKGDAVVVDFKLENAGTYDVIVSGWQLNSLGIVGAFSIDGINVGSFDFSYSDPNGSDQNASAKIGTISLEAGVHKMRILRANTDSGGDLLFLSNVKFTPAESAAPAEQYVDFCVPSGSKSPSAFAKELDGWEVDSANTTAPQSGDNYVVQIDPYGLKVVMNPNERIVLDFNVARDGVYDVTIRGSQFNGLGLDGKFLIDGVPVGEYSFHCTESSNAGFEKTIGSIALTGGTHKLTIYRTDSTSSGYMFIAGMRLTPVTLSTGIAQTCSFLGGSGLTLPEHAQLNLHGWSLNAAKTAETIPTRTGNYEVGATSGIKAEFASGETMTLNFNVGVEGFYQVDITGWKVQNYGILGSIAIDGTPLGTYDFSDLATSNVLTDVTEMLGKIALSAGPHELSITKADPNGNRDGTAGGFGYMWLTGMSLTPTTPDPVSEDMKFTMSLENASGEAQEHFNPGDIIYVKALLNGAGSYQFGALQADVSYDDTKLELVEDETTAGDSITINKSYAADTVRMAYGGASISASAPYTLGTIALRVKRGVETGDSVISYANTNVSKYNNSEWAASTAENAAAKLHNITVSFTQGENGAMSTSTFYAKYNAAGLYTADDYATAATEPEPTANDKYRLADEDARWMKSGEAATSFAAIAATAHMENAEYAAQYVRQRTVTFLAGEHGTITAGGSVTVDDGAVLTEENIPTPAPETGYEFTGWKVAGGDAIDPVGQTIMADTSYTAQYALKKYAVSFHDSDGSLIGTAQTVEHGSYASTVDPSKSDSEFRGWYIVTDANESYTDQTLYTSEQINAAAVTADISYKALYSLNVYRVTTDAANAEVSFVSGVTDGKVTAGEAIVFTLTAKSGYTTADAEVSCQIGTETAVALTAGEDGSYTIPASQVNGNVKIIAVLKLDLTAEIVSMENVADYRVLKVETGKLPEGKVYQYDGATTLYYSEAHNAYVCLVPADDTQASAKLSLADGTVLAIARGDINGDTAVDTLDAMLTYTYYNNVDGKFDTLISEKNAALLFALDYNGDFVVNILDVTAIIIAYLGL